MKDAQRAPNPRREFLGRMSTGALAVAATGLVALPPLAAAEPSAPDEAWLDAIKGKHRSVYDAVSVNDGWMLAFAMNFMDTIESTYSLTDADVTAVASSRHFAIPMVFNDAIWAKYKLGEFGHVTDPATKAPATRNIFYHSKPGDLLFPNAAIEKLQARGVIFTCCNVALTALSGLLGGKVGVSAGRCEEGMDGRTPSRRDRGSVGRAGAE